MKKYLNRIGLTAVAALTLLGCAKELEGPTEQGGTHTIQVTLSKPEGTKTAVIEGETSASYKWLSGDKEYLKIYENNVLGTIDETDGFVLSENDKIATLKVTFPNSSAESFTYKAIYAKDISGSKNPLIQSEQHPGTSSFDPAADVMFSKEITSDSRLSSLQFVMGRVVTVNKMTLTGLVEGEVISSVELTLNQHLAGYVSYDENNEQYTYSYGGTKLTMKYTTASGTVPTSGKFPVYFISAPVDAASIVSIIVTTDQNVYTKSTSCNPNPFDGKTISFAIGTMTRFSMGMSGYGEPISSGVDYTLVESTDDLFNGATYIIVGSDVDYAVGLFTGGNNHTAVAITKSLNAQNKSIVTIDNTVAIEPVLLTRVGSNWTIKNNVSDNAYFGQYLICGTGTNNRLQETSSESSEYKEWTISISNGVATINNTNTSAQRSQMYFNQNGTSPMFACYAPGQTNSNYHTVALYVDKTTCVELEEAGLAYSVTSPIEVTWDDKDNFVKPTLTNPHSLTVTYASSDEEVATVDENTGDITFIGNGTTTITASSAKTNTYKAGSAQYQITVSGAPAEKGSKHNPYTASEARAAAIALEGEASSNEVYVKGIVSEVTTAYSTQFKNVTFNISNDGLTTSDQFKAYREKSSYSNTVAAGDAVVIKGTIINYNSSTPEFLENNAIQSLLVKPTISGEENFTAASTSVTLSAVEGATIYYTTDGSNPNTSSSVYTTAISISATTTVKAIAAKDGLETGIATKTFNKVLAYAVTWSTPLNGTISVKHGETSLTSGDTIAEGETITITTTPANGYKLSTLVYNDGTDHDIKGTKSFTMPAHSVSITATFEESNIGVLTIDFEGTVDSYSVWTFTNCESQQTGKITAHGGTYYGTTGGKASGSIQTKEKVSSPQSLTCYVSKQSSNTTSSTWYIQVSSNGTNWIDVKSQSATSMSQGKWVEFTADLSSYNDVYVRVYYSGSTAVRNIDDLTLTYN